MTGWDPATIATLVLSVATLVVAAGTLWLGHEARAARLSAAADRDREAFRKALVEAGDRLRAWLTWAPLTGSMASGIPDVPVALDGTRHLLAVTPVSSDSLAYLLWSETAVRSLSAAYLDVVYERVRQWAPPTPGLGAMSDEGQALHLATLRQLLLTARVIIAEAESRGFDEVPRAFGPMFVDIGRSWERYFPLPVNQTVELDGLLMGSHHLSPAPPLPAAARNLPPLA